MKVNFRQVLELIADNHAHDVSDNECGPDGCSCNETLATGALVLAGIMDKDHIHPATLRWVEIYLKKQNAIEENGN